MNAATVNGIRQMWTEITAPKIERTAREMAMESHKLSCDGMKATTADGQAWYWVSATERWTR